MHIAGSPSGHPSCKQRKAGHGGLLTWAAVIGLCCLANIVLLKVPTRMYNKARLSDHNWFKLLRADKCQNPIRPKFLLGLRQWGETKCAARRVSWLQNWVALMYIYIRSSMSRWLLQHNFIITFQCFFWNQKIPYTANVIQHLKNKRLILPSRNRKLRLFTWGFPTGSHRYLNWGCYIRQLCLSTLCIEPLISGVYTWVAGGYDMRYVQCTYILCPIVKWIRQTAIVTFKKAN